MNNKFNKKIVKREYTPSDKLVVSTANLLNEINVKELDDVKKKVLERKRIIENNSK